MSGGNTLPKPHLPTVTLLSVDCTDKVHLAERAIEKTLEQCTFDAVKLLTHEAHRAHAEVIPKIESLEAYSHFMVRKLHEHVDTSHCLVIQSDGWVINGAAWTDEFLRYDYIGSPWEHWGGKVGNGGFSLRSRRLLEAGAQLDPTSNPHPEDAWLCHQQRGRLEAWGCRFAPTPLARKFGFEGRAYNGTEWSGDGRSYNQAFGFHSFLSPLPSWVDAPLVFHTSGDIGDLVYSLAVARELGGGAYFVSPDCKYPFPRPPKACRDSMAFHLATCRLSRKQPYIWNQQHTHTTPHSTDVDFNRFREAYHRGGSENWKSLLQLHAQPFGVDIDGSTPWLECDDPLTIPGRPIVVNLTQRYRNYEFPWWQLIRRYGHQMVFVGSVAEHAALQGHAPDITIPHQSTSDLWEVARVIKGGKVFVGNQSSPLAVAHGLGQNVVVEEWAANPNCHIERPNAMYPKGSAEIILPEEWLA